MVKNEKKILDVYGGHTLGTAFGIISVLIPGW